MIQSAPRHATTWPTRKTKSTSDHFVKNNFFQEENYQTLGFGLTENWRHRTRIHKMKGSPYLHRQQCPIVGSSSNLPLPHLTSVKTSSSDQTQIFSFSWPNGGCGFETKVWTFLYFPRLGKYSEYLVTFNSKAIHVSNSPGNDGIFRFYSFVYTLESVLFSSTLI